MGSKMDPSTLPHKWSLRGGFELLVYDKNKKEGRSKAKNYGTVTEMGHTTKGKLDNKADQVFMMLKTNKQEEDDAPYGVQLLLMDIKELNSDLKSAYNKNLPASPTLLQVASKLCCPCPIGCPRCMCCCDR